MNSARYPWHLPLKLASHIQHHQASQALERLKDVVGIVARKRGETLTLRKLRCAQMASFCLRGALKGGAPGDAIFLEHLKMLERLGRARTWPGVALLMRRYVEQLLDRVRPQRRTNLELFVAWMRKDMRSTISNPKSLEEYASTGLVSVGHLSRRFGAIAGSTYRVELRRLRFESALKMVADPELKVATIARLVGLRDPSQFIADFKREYGVTPNAYRNSVRARRRTVFR